MIEFVDVIKNSDPDPACDCPDMLNNQHNRSECTSGCKCDNCKVEFLYRGAITTYMTDGKDVWPVYICPVCSHQILTFWNNEAQANEMYPEGCQCVNEEENEEICSHCKVLLTSPEALQEAEWEALMSRGGKNIIESAIGRIDAGIVVGKFNFLDVAYALEILFEARWKAIKGL